MKSPHIAQRNINATKAASLNTGVVEILPAPVHHVELGSAFSEFAYRTVDAMGTRLIGPGWEHAQPGWKPPISRFVR